MIRQYTCRACGWSTRYKALHEKHLCSYRPGPMAVQVHRSELIPQDDKISGALIKLSHHDLVAPPFVNNGEYVIDKKSSFGLHVQRIGRGLRPVPVIDQDDPCDEWAYYANGWAWESLKRRLREGK